MKYKRIYKGQTQSKNYLVEIDGVWQLITNNNLTFIDLLNMPLSKVKTLQLEKIQDPKIYNSLIPFRPAAYRDFMLYEKHAIEAARGFVKKYMPHMLPIVSSYEKVFRKPFPKLKPKKRFYQHPIYYMGNHLNFISEGDSISIPSYTQEMDYELELGAIITKPLKNASIEEVQNAIGGFLILNDFSARDIQLDEMESGFGPMKTKNFASSISSTVVGKDFIIDKIDNLEVKVIINGDTIAESNTRGKFYSFQEAIAYASWEEQLHPGELFGFGTIPGCSGIENGRMLNKGDTITLEVEEFGTLSNKII